VTLAGLHVEQHGEGGALVLAHGFAGSARNWRPQVREFRTDHRVVTYDARGHARSDAPQDPQAYTEAAHVADLAAVVAASGDAAPIVGGLSMGAATALRYALEAAVPPRALVLASYPADPGSGLGVSAQAESFADALERDGVDAAGARFAWGPGSGLDARGAALVRQGFLEHPAHGLAHTLREFLAVRPGVAELVPALQRFGGPVLVIAGALDRGSLPVCRELAGQLPAAELAVVPDAGHVVNLAQPARVDAILRDFLDRRLPHDRD